LDRNPAVLAHPNAVLRLIPSSDAETVTLPVRSNEAKKRALASAEEPENDTVAATPDMIGCCSDR
jgi:hypothetical protein